MVKHSHSWLMWMACWPFIWWQGFTTRFGWIKRSLLRLLCHPILALGYVLLCLAVVYGFIATMYDLGKLRSMPARSIVLDRQGVEMGRLHGEKRTIVPLKEISDNFYKAIIAREDERFYEHGAFDFIGIGRAVLKNLEGKREGASTITQQLASDIFALKEAERDAGAFKRPMQIHRKLLEIAIAVRIEQNFTKDEILEAYINQINWGRQIKGVGEASRIYFEKHPSELDLSESATLAGIVRGPDAFNPFRSLDASYRERNTTLARMVDAKKITTEQARVAKSAKLKIRPEGRRRMNESYAMDAIRRDLEIILEKENIALGGLTIISTIDYRLQKAAEESMEKRLALIERSSGYEHVSRSKWLKSLVDETQEPEYLQGSAVVVENRTGAILVCVGGRNANESSYNRAIQSHRQVGSIFKPMVYLAAFDKGLHSHSLVNDDQIQQGEIEGGGTWKPNNSDGKYMGWQTAAYGLIRSRNTMTVRVGNFAGFPYVQQVAKDAGFACEMPQNPSSYLGSWEASPLEVASAYTLFPNDGVRYRPYLISEIKDRDGNVLYSTPPLSYQAAQANSAWSVSRIMQDVMESGTAASISRYAFSAPCGGKTGTTNDFRDAWFSGFTSNLSCAVWVGFDTPKRIVDRGYGATLALPVWADIMKASLAADYKAGRLDSKKVPSISCELCRLSGKRATNSCVKALTAYKTSIARDLALSKNDFCPIHPAEAEAVEEPAAEIPIAPIPKAVPVLEADDEVVDEPVLQAQPVDE